LKTYELPNLQAFRRNTRVAPFDWQSEPTVNAINKFTMVNHPVQERDVYSIRPQMLHGRKAGSIAFFYLSNPAWSNRCKPGRRLNS